MVSLHQTQAAWNRDERNRINENWQRIAEGFSGMQRQINILAGGEEVDELLERIQRALDDAEVGVQEYINQVDGVLEQAIEANNTATQEAITANNTALQESLSTVSQTLQELTVALNNAETATSEAVTAKDAAVKATNDARTAIANMQGLINNFKHRGTWSSSVAYSKNNLVEHTGRTYIALQDNTNTPVTTASTWALFADRGLKGDKGEKGEPGAGLNIIGSLSSPDDLPDTGAEGDAYTINGNLYIWNGTGWENVGNIKGEKGDTGMSAYEIAVAEGYEGTQDEWLASLRGNKGDTGPQGPAGQDADVAPLQQQLDNHESRLETLEDEANTAIADVSGLNREVAYLKLKQDASDRIEGGVTFADDMNGSRFGFALNEAESSNIKVRNGKMLMLKDETRNYNTNNTTVVASAYSTAGNGGRKLVRLENGTLITAIKGTSAYYLYKSIDNATTWTLGKTITASPGDIAVAANGDRFSVVYTSGDKYINVDHYDSNFNVLIASKTLDSQTALGNVSLTIDPTNGHLHAAWSSKNSTYPNSFNIRYAKSIDGGATWSAVEQITKMDTTNCDLLEPSIIIKNNLPTIIFSQRFATNHAILCQYYNGSSWVTSGSSGRGKWITPDGNTYTQSSPSVVVDKDGTVLTAWHGRDATHTTTDYIRFSKSSDGGTTWITMQKLVPGTNTSISVDKNNKYIITYENGGNIYRIESMDKGATWTAASPVLVGAGTNPSSLYDPDFQLTFTTVPTVHMASSAVKFTGNWSETLEVPTTTATAVYDIPSTNYVGAFVQKAGAINMTASMNGVPMQSELEGDEYEITGTLATEAPVKLRLELSRTSTAGGENDAVTRILGGRS